MSIEEEQEMDWGPGNEKGEIEKGKDEGEAEKGKGEGETEKGEKEDSGDENANVFVKYLPAEINDADLRHLFASCGEIVSAKVMKDGSSGASLGFGFVRFSSPDGAQSAVKSMNGTYVGSKALLCKISAPSICPQLSTNLYIKPIPLEFTEDHLKQVFSPFGTIVTAKILFDKSTGESKQIGFVKFDDQASATAAIEKMNGCKLTSDAPCLIVKYAESDIQRVTRQARIHPPPKRKYFTHNNFAPVPPPPPVPPVPPVPPAWMFYPYAPGVPYPMVGYYPVPPPPRTPYMYGHPASFSGTHKDPPIFTICCCNLFTTCQRVVYLVLLLDTGRDGLLFFLLFLFLSQ